jgi:hypothetical protein
MTNKMMCLIRFMSRFRLSWIALLFALLASISSAGDESISPRLELNVSELKPSSLFPGAKAYFATLTNTTTQPIPLELLQMTTGYLGGGVFYPCAVQFWNSKTKKWWTIPPRNKRSEHTVGQLIHSEIKPNETLEVCRRILMKERIKGGRCARFAFTFHYDHKPDILSKPFMIPDPEKPDNPIRCAGLQR